MFNLTQGLRLLGQFKVAATGQTLAEYGLVIGLIAIATLGTLQLMGGQISGLLTNMGDTMSNGTGIPGVSIGSPAASPANPNPSEGQIALIENPETPNPGTNPGTSPNPEPSTMGSTTPTFTNPSIQPVEPPATATGPAGTTPASDPQYQQWLAQNPQTAGLINQLSPQGQQAANEAYSFYSASTETPPVGGIIQKLQNTKGLPEADVQKIIAYRASLATSVGE